MAPRNCHLGNYQRRSHANDERLRLSEIYRLGDAVSKAALRDTEQRLISIEPPATYTRVHLREAIDSGTSLYRIRRFFPTCRLGVAFLSLPIHDPLPAIEISSVASTRASGFYRGQETRQWRAFTFVRAARP